jgi:hypothetical protein
MANKKSWSATPPKKITPTVPSLTISTLKEKADKLIDDVIKPQNLQPATDDVNYLSDIHSKWYRGYFYFCATYNCPSPNAVYPSFEIKFARMEYIDDNRFNLAYMRYTGQWWEVFQDISMDDCLKEIEENPIFTP